MPMKLIHLIALLLLIPFSALAGTFLETFDDKDLEDWQELVQLNKVPGSWEVVDGELHAISRETFLRLLTTGNDTWGDYTVEFDVKPLKKHGIGRISIAARVNGTSVVYCAIHDPVVIVGDKPPVHEPRADCVAGNLHNVIFAPLNEAPHALLKLNRWSHLKLSVQGNIFTFWVNDKEVMEPTELLIFKQVEAFKGIPGFSVRRCRFRSVELHGTLSIISLSPAIAFQTKVDCNGNTSGKTRYNVGTTERILNPYP